jgi:hypothetical protein
MADIDIAVVKTPKGYVVRPACVIVRAGDTLLFHNLTGKVPATPKAGEGIVVNFPTSQLFKFAAEPECVKVAVPPGLSYGFHPYSVYSQRANDFCKGESTPGIIIKG